MRKITEIFFPLGIPFSWLQLTSSPPRFFTAAAGVSFASILILLQLGFYDGILDQVVHPVRSMNGEIIMVSKQFEQLTASGPFSKRRAEQAKSFSDVEDVFPVYTVMSVIKNIETGENKEIFVLAFDPADEPFAGPMMKSGKKFLKNEERVLFDEFSENVYGPVAERLKREGEISAEMENTRIVISGLFSMGSTLAAKGHLLMSDMMFLRLFKNRAPNMINIAVVKLKPGADPAAVAEKMQKKFSEDIKVFTKDAFIEREQVYWRDRTPIGFVVSAGLLVAMVVGCLIVYQILFNDVNSHIGEYATLKAVGIRDYFFVKTILEESLILMFCGIIPGAGASALMYKFARHVTNMPIYMSWNKIAIVCVLMLAACLFAGLLATKELRAADPAEIF